MPDTYCDHLPASHTKPRLIRATTVQQNRARATSRHILHNSTAISADKGFQCVVVTGTHTHANCRRALAEQAHVVYSMTEDA
jgi:hypothetical protein